jgi:hypothetical protein
MIKSKILFLLASALWCTGAVAQGIEPIQADRPDQTETPFTVPRNHFQMELGFVYEKTNDVVESYTLPTALLKYGLNDHFEIGIITEMSGIKTRETQYGLIPVSLRFKERICDENGLLPMTSFIGYLAVPKVASEGFQATYFAPSFRFTMQHSLSEKMVLAYNLGAEWDGESAEPIFIYTLTTGMAFTNKFGGYIELYGYAPQNSLPDHRCSAGISYLIKPNVMVDLSGGYAFSEPAPDYYVGVGFSFRLKD